MRCRTSWLLAVGVVGPVDLCGSIGDTACVASRSAGPGKRRVTRSAQVDGIVSGKQSRTQEALFRTADIEKMLLQRTRPAFAVDHQRMPASLIANHHDSIGTQLYQDPVIMQVRQCLTLGFSQLHHALSVALAH